MSTYKKGHYGADRYRNLRPEYPARFYKFIQSHFRQKPGLAVDLGCGTGQATHEIAKMAAGVIGMDHSQAMIDLALAQNTSKNATFRVGNDEVFASEFADNSVDLITVAEAAHYFDLPQFYKNAHRILTKGGLLVIWGYKDDVVQGQPEATKIIADYCYGADYLGNYYDDGLKRFQHFYSDYMIPSDLFSDVTYHKNSADTISDTEVLELRRTVQLKEYMAYFRSFSSFQNWLDKNPDATPENDIVAEMTERILRETTLTLDSEITVKWNTVFMIGRK